MRPLSSRFCFAVFVFLTALITDLQPCPPIVAGTGQVVTATFSHPPSQQVLEVQFEGESSPLGVTDNHRFWSVDRHEFLPIGQMQLGERVQTFHGDTKRNVQKLPRPGPQVVYNLEVYGEHVYFVGEQGLLAHNMYGGGKTVGLGLEGAFPELRARGALTFESFHTHKLSDIELRNIPNTESLAFFSEIRKAVSRSDGVLFGLDGLNLRRAAGQLREPMILGANTTVSELRIALESASRLSFLQGGRIYNGKVGLIEAAFNNPTILNSNGIFTGNSADYLKQFLDNALPLR